MAKNSTFDLEKTAFTPEELSAIAAQWGEKEEPGFFSQAVDTAGAIITGAPLVMRGAGFGLRDLVQGFDPNDTEAMADRAAYERDLAAYQKKYEGSGAVPEAFAEAAGSSGPSLVGTGASLVGMGLGTLGGPVGMAGGAFAAGGAAAARMDYAAASAQLYDEVVRRMGRKPTDAEWQGILSDMRPDLLKHAAIEGVGEGAGDVLLGAAFKPFAPLAKAAGGALGSSVAGKVVRGAGSLGAGIAGEVVTETGQQWGQGHVEADMFGGEAPTIGEAFEQVAGPTAAQTVMTGGLIGGARLGLSMLRRTTPSNSPDNPFAEQAPSIASASGRANEVGRARDVVEGELVNEDVATRSGGGSGSSGGGSWETWGTGIEGGTPLMLEGPAAIEGSSPPSALPHVPTGVGPAIDVVEGELVGDEVGSPRQAEGGWETWGTGIEGRAPLMIGGPSGRQSVPDSAPTPSNSPEIDLMAPRPAAGAFGLMNVRGASPQPPQLAIAQPAPVQSAPTIPNSGLGLAGVQPVQPQKVEPLLEESPSAESDSVSKKAARPRKGKSKLGKQLGEVNVNTEDNGVVNVRMFAEADNEDNVVVIMEGNGDFPISTYKKSMLDSEGGVHGLARYILEPLGVMDVAEASNNVTKQPEMMAENVTSAKPLSTESSTNVGLENKSKSKGESGKSLVERMEERALERKAFHYKGKKVYPKMKPLADPERESEFAAKLAEAGTKTLNAGDVVALANVYKLRDEYNERGLASDEAMKELDEILAFEYTPKDADVSETETTETSADGEEQTARKAATSKIDGVKNGKLEEGNGRRPLDTVSLEGGDRGSEPSGYVGGRPAEAPVSEQPVRERAGREAEVKIPNRASLPVRYELVEADDIQASHLPRESFVRNPLYGLENERQYHSEPASRDKVVNIASKLDPDFLFESVDANQGAPVVDHEGNVLGGNGRAMSIELAYDRFPDRADAYREAIASRAESLGLDADAVRKMERPVLVRRTSQEISRSERQALVSALNDDFKSSRERRAEGKSRGDRFSAGTLKMLGEGMREADSLRDFFNKEESRRVVDAMLKDGVIAETDRNALVGADGLLNPDGKRVIEEALRGRIAKNYEALSKLPSDIVGKLDAAIPYFLQAELAGKGWDVTGDLSEALSAVADYRKSGAKDIGQFLGQIDMMSGKSRADRLSAKARALFNALEQDKKKEFVQKAGKYAFDSGMAGSNALPGMAKSPEQAFKDAFGIDVSNKDGGSKNAVHDTQRILEPDSEGRPAENRVGEESLSDDGRGNGEAGRAGARGAGEGVSDSGGESVSRPAASASGERSDSDLAAQEPSERGELGGVPGSSGRGRSGGDGNDGLVSGRREPAETSRPAAEGSGQVKKDEPKGLREVRKALPKLFEGQQEDVYFAEQRWKRGLGVLFTNGTGTGKTGLGLGAIKRLVDAGRNNILVAVPADKIGSDWVTLGQVLGVDVTKLEDTKDKGRGVTITTHANMAQNSAIFNREWDLVVIDECHKLIASKDGTKTNLLEALRGLTYHPAGAFVRAQKIGKGPELWDEYEKARDDLALEEKSLDSTDAALAAANARYDKASKAWIAHLEKVEEDVAKPRPGNRANIEYKGDAGKPGVMLLSATPFAYEKSVEYADGYLFDFDRTERRGYNDPSGFEKFMVEHFGYRMRYGKLTEPEAGVDRGLLQRQFNSWLKKLGALSSRQLDTPFDYDRKFILTENAIGQKIDEGFGWLWEHHSDYPVLEEHLRKRFNFLRRQYLLETIKANEAVPLIRENVELGRKVVVFYQYNKPIDMEQSLNPFDVSDIIRGEEAMGDTELFDEARNFAKERPDLQRLDLNSLRPSLETLKTAFPNAVVFAGTESKKAREEGVKKFQADDSGVDVILVQADAGEAGISLHDKTGKHQRILFNLGLPVKPVTSIQQEGRIFRAGQQSNAMFRYLNTGTTWERIAFAQTVANRASAAENLALGEEARGLKDAFINAFEESGPANFGDASEGTGGKQADRELRQLLSDFDRAKALYWANQKKTAKNKAKEGKDYFPTPEPLGQKMVEWAGLSEGDRMLEPSAGHGAIARWAPEGVDLTVIEPSEELHSRLLLAVDARRAERGTFEDHALMNKYNAIVMNPPFGSGGKLAVEHLAKAFRHLAGGGRIVAIIPEGPSANKHFDRWMATFDDVKPGVARPVLVREVSLPSVTFERAGTAVKTRVVILDSVTGDAIMGGRVAQMSRVELDSAKTANELFDRLENMEAPARPGKTGSRPVNTTSSGSQREHKPLFKLAETEHAIKKIPMYVATFAKHEERVVFDKARGVAKEHDGWYSKFDKNGAIPGFQFTTEQDRADFVREMEEFMGNDDGGAYASLRPSLEGSGARQASSIHRKAIRDAVQAMDKATGQTTVVVDSFDQLTSDLQEMFAGRERELEGVYHQGVVYMVADNLRSSARAGSVWMHEHAGHGGFESLMGEREKTQLLNRLFGMLGGRGNKALDHIARKYKADTTTSKGRALVMREYLAHLMESRDLNEKERSLWQKAWKHIADTLRKLWYRATGRNVQLGEMEVRDLLDAMLNNVRKQGGESYASLGSKNEHGVLKERVVHVSGTSLSPDDIAEGLKALAGRDLENVIEELYAQVNSTQRRKLVSTAAARQSASGGFGFGQHFGAAKIIENLWKWAAKAGTKHDPKDDPAMNVERFVAAINVDGREAFAFLTAKVKKGERKLYSVELMNKKKLLSSLDTLKAEAIRDTPVRSFEEIVERLNREVNSPDGPKGGTYASFISDAAKSAADKVAKAMKKPEGFSDDFMESYKNLSAQAKRDLSWWNRFVSQPYALAKKFPLLRALMDIQSQREDKRREAYLNSMRGVDSFQKMKESDPTAYEYARDLIVSLDSELGDELKEKLDEKMFLFDDEGNRVGFNPKYYTQLRELVLQARNKEKHSDDKAFERAVDAYMGVRRSLDRDLAAILSRVEDLASESEKAFRAAYKSRKAELDADTSLTQEQKDAELKAMRDAHKPTREKEKLDAMRRSMGRRPFYFPRMRFGDYFARFVDADGKTLYRVHYDASSMTQAAHEAAKIKSMMEDELKKMGVDLADVKFENGKIEGVPQEVFADALSTVDTQAILDQALERMERGGKMEAKELKKLRDALFEQVSEVLKSSGFGQHMMRRGNSNIAGYETEDVFKSLSAYKAGLHGWLTKMEASYAFASTLSEAAEDGAARKSPKMYGYAKQYVRDMLRNSDAIDRTNSRIRAGLFLWFLGGNIKSALVNATQNFSLGVPVLGTEIGFGKAYGKILAGSHDAVVDWASKREAGQESKRLTKDEAAFLDDFQKHGEALARKTMELTGMQDRSWTSTWYGKVAEWAGKPIEYAEKFNRMSLALAAYRAAKAGDVTNESTLAEYGEEKGKPWSEASARKFAREVVNEAHFVYGKANQPAPVRGFARGLGFGYTFRTYAQSLGSWYYHMLAGEKGNVGRIAAAQAALHATMLGGVAAIPLYGTMRTVLTQLFGGEPPEEVLGYDQIDILMYGLPSLGGVYLGGSMELDLPAIAGAKQGDESWIEQLHDNVFLAVTGPLGGALDRLGRATYFADTGQTGRVLEELAPTAVTNVLKAHRLATTGARTKSGKPIPAPGDKSGKPAQLSGAEVVLQGLGFQPMSRAKGWQAYQTKQEKTAYKSDFQSDLVTRYVMAKANKDWKEVDKLVAEWRDWNKEHPDQKIKPLAQLAKRRERPVK